LGHAIQTFTCKPGTVAGVDQNRPATRLAIVDGGKLHFLLARYRRKSDFAVFPTCKWMQGSRVDEAGWPAF